MSEVISGKNLAKDILAKCKQKAAYLIKNTKRPNLCFIIVGENPASHLYVKYKRAACAEIDISSKLINLPEDASTEQVIAAINELNKDETTNGILVQLPLPKQIDTDAVLQAVDPNKDVDGLHPLNQGLSLANHSNQPRACTPLAILYILEQYNVEVKGKVVTVVGRSRIVGRPLAVLLINQGATVRVCNSNTKDLKNECLAADILIVAAGSPKLITEEMVKEGCFVIDVGINKVADNKVVGDVDFATVKDKASVITPVPNGVGPLTVAMLMQNTIKLAKAQMSK